MTLPQLKVGAICLNTAGLSLTLTCLGQGFVVSVTHFPRVSSSSVDVGTGKVEKNVIGTGSTIYRRMILFENDEKRIQIIGERFGAVCRGVGIDNPLRLDPRLYALDKGDAFVCEY